VTVDVSEFQPFRSRVGVDTVLALRSEYDPKLVETMKAALLDARQFVGGKPAGGWLKVHDAWFVERPAWPHIRDVLQASGHTIREAVQADPPPPIPPSIQPSIQSPSDLGLTCRQCGGTAFLTHWEAVGDTRRVRMTCAGCRRSIRLLPQTTDGMPDVRRELSALPKGHPARQPVLVSDPWIGLVRQDDGVWIPVALAASLGKCWETLLACPLEGDRLCIPGGKGGGER
jgi:hypothetical protein